MFFKLCKIHTCSRMSDKRLRFGAERCFVILVTDEKQKSFETFFYTYVFSFPNRKKIKPVKTEAICRRQNECGCKTTICFKKGRKHGGKGRKCWLPAFSPFLTMFLKASFLRVVKSRDCVVKSLV